MQEIIRFYRLFICTCRELRGHLIGVPYLCGGNGNSFNGRFGVGGGGGGSSRYRWFIRV